MPKFRNKIRVRAVKNKIMIRNPRTDQFELSRDFQKLFGYGPVLVFKIRLGLKLGPGFFGPKFFKKTKKNRSSSQISRFSSVLVSVTTSFGPSTVKKIRIRNKTVQTFSSSCSRIVSSSFLSSF